MSACIPDHAPPSDDALFIRGKANFSAISSSIASLTVHLPSSVRSIPYSPAYKSSNLDVNPSTLDTNLFSFIETSSLDIALLACLIIVDIELFSSSSLSVITSGALSNPFLITGREE